MSKESYLKAPCAHCNGRISFPASARGMTVACPHCGGQTLLDAGAAAAPVEEASAPEPEPSAPEPPPAEAARPKPTPVAARPAAAQSAAGVGKPLTAVQQAAIAAARASARSSAAAASRPGAKPADKKPAVLKPAWTDEEAEAAEAKPVRCDFCGAKVPRGEPRCPDCGTVVLAKAEAPAKPSWFRRVGVTLIFLLSIGAAVEWGRLYVSVRPKVGKDGQPLKQGVELLNHGMQAQPGTALMYVRGNVTNHSDVPYFSVKVECELLDKTGAPLGKVSDTRMVLDAHKLFPFSVSILDPDAKSYTNITVSAQR